jgi:CRP/FNR family transcriptional regulator, cyclic AMP receptor protein
MRRMTNPTADELKRVPLFSALSGPDRALLAANLEMREVAPGTTLIEEGQNNASFYVLRDGEVEVSVQGVPRRTVGPGAFFGEISLEHDVPATASLVTRTPATLYVLSQTQYRSLQKNTAAVIRLKAIMTDRQAADRLFA